MEENKGKAVMGPFLCTVAEKGQIFIPVKAMEIMGIKTGDVVKFSIKKGKTTLVKDEEASKNEAGLGAKKKSDDTKIAESLK